VQRSILASLLVLSVLLGPVAAPTGAKLAYQKRGPQNKTQGVYVARDDGSDPHKIAGGYSPYISPTGHRVAYFGKGRRSLYVVGVGGRNRRLLIPGAYDPGLGEMLGWRQDDRRVVAAGFKDGDTPGYLANVREGTRLRVGQGPEFRGASFAPSGSKFALGDADGVAWGMAVVRTDPLRRRYIGSGYAPKWGARGLAFARSDRIIVRDNSGKRRTVLRESAERLYPIDWSDDGRVLLVAAKAPGVPQRDPWRALLVEPQSGEVVRVPSHLGEIWGLSGNGRAVLAEKGRDVVSVNAAGGLRTLVREAAHPTWTK
jgi:hypothetical protein